MSHRSYDSTLDLSWYSKEHILGNINLYRVLPHSSNRIGLVPICDTATRVNSTAKFDSIAFVFIARQDFDNYTWEEILKRSALKHVTIISPNQVIQNGCRFSYPQ